MGGLSLSGGQCLDQVIEFPLERFRTIHGGGDLVLDELAESLPETMDGGFECPVGQVQRTGRQGGIGVVLARR